MANVEFRDETLCCLGLTLAKMGRDEEARQCLERAVALGDRTGTARAFISDLLLEGRTEPERALALIEASLTVKTSRLRLAGRAAVRARALAALGRQREMDEAIAAALRDLDPNENAMTAGIHLDIGKALVAAQRIPGAIEHFRTACRTHPEGQLGSAARQELEKLGAPGA